jgi:hypothetical protein
MHTGIYVDNLSSKAYKRSKKFPQRDTDFFPTIYVQKTNKFKEKISCCQITIN